MRIECATFTKINDVTITTTISNNTFKTSIKEHPETSKSLDGEFPRELHHTPGGDQIKPFSGAVWLNLGRSPHRYSNIGLNL